MNPRIVPVALGLTYAAVMVAALAPPRLTAARPGQVTATPPPPIGPPWPWPTPSPTPQDRSDPEARAILGRSDDAMNALMSVRMRIETRNSKAPADPAYATSSAEFAAPDRMHSVHDSGFGRQEDVHIGRDAWTRSGDKPWEHRFNAFAYRWPRFDRLYEPGSEWRSAARNVRIVREEELPSGTAVVLSYEYGAMSEEGRFFTFMTEWIDKRTNRLLRQDETNDDPWGSRALIRSEFFDFDAPISIEPPMPATNEAALPSLFMPAAWRGEPAATVVAWAQSAARPPRR